MHSVEQGWPVSHGVAFGMWITPQLPKMEIIDRFILVPPAIKGHFPLIG